MLHIDRQPIRFEILKIVISQWCRYIFNKFLFQIILWPYKLTQCNTILFNKSKSGIKSLGLFLSCCWCWNDRVVGLWYWWTVLWELTVVGLEGELLWLWVVIVIDLVLYLEVVFMGCGMLVRLMFFFAVRGWWGIVDVVWLKASATLVWLVAVAGYVWHYLLLLLL